MNLTEELQKLATLYDEGHLSEQEFSDAKARLLASSGPTPTASSSPAKNVADTNPAIKDEIYWSSRWSSGNLFFRDRLTIAGDGMTFQKGAMFSSNEEHINFRAVASIRVNHGIFLSNLTIETSGGSQPIFINGLWKSDAKEIQDFIRVFQGRS